MKRSNIFWVSYSDLLTSLFFVMLVLYIITFVILQQKLGTMEADARKLKEIENVEKALQTLDTTYFTFDNENKRYKLNVDVNFRSNSWDITDISNSDRLKIIEAGSNLYEKMQAVIDTNTRSDIDYLMVVEGNTQRSNNNWINNPDGGYRLSYKRALALYNFWEDNGINFRELGTQCEVIIAGSGYFSQSRDTINEENNRRFTIQVTSKVGKFLHKKSS